MATTRVLIMLPVLTQRVITTVHATLAMVEMASPVLVSTNTQSCIEQV